MKRNKPAGSISSIADWKTLSQGQLKHVIEQLYTSGIVPDRSMRGNKDLKAAIEQYQATYDLKETGLLSKSEKVILQYGLQPEIA